MWNENFVEFAWCCCRPKQRPPLRSIFLSVIGLWVKIWHRNKTTCSEWNPVQNSRSKLTTCPRKGHLLRFESNSTATSDGGAQKLGNDVRRDSESITTKVCSLEWITTKACSQIGCEWNVMFESHVVIWRFFEQSAFVNIHLLCYWPTILNSILKICPKFQVISSDFF